MRRDDKKKNVQDFDFYTAQVLFFELFEAYTDFHLTLLRYRSTGLTLVTGKINRSKSARSDFLTIFFMTHEENNFRNILKKRRSNESE